MKALQWYPWYWQDWQASYAVIRMTLAERGLYRELLDASWKAGGLPNHEQALADHARASLPDFQEHWPTVRPHWKLRPDGLLYNDHLEDVRGEQLTLHSKRVEAGRKGGKSSIAQARLSKAQALKQSRVETTLTTATGRRSTSAAPPLPVLASDVPDLVGDPPTPEQVAANRAVIEGLKR